MKVQSIESRANPLLKEIRSLHERAGRQKHGRLLLEGHKLVAEAYAKQLPVETVVASRSFFDHGLSDELSSVIDSIKVVEDKLFLELCTTVSSPGILAVAELPFKDASDLSKDISELGKFANSRIVILDGVQDPGNLGTIIRTSLAFGVDRLILTKGTADATNPKVVRSAMGSLFALPVYQEADAQSTLTLAKQSGFTVVALDVDGQSDLKQLPENTPLSFLFGSEGQGSQKALLKLADKLVRVAIEPNCESLNVAVCAGIVLNHAYRESSRRNKD